uniref:CSON003718 protein n=1 Tax=Culicoides sonorensis TaxID=179676 RepID=A0A336MP04_CULSO
MKFFILIFSTLVLNQCYCKSSFSKAYIMKTHCGKLEPGDFILSSSSYPRVFQHIKEEITTIYKFPQSPYTNFLNKIITYVVINITSDDTKPSIDVINGDLYRDRMQIKISVRRARIFTSKVVVYGNWANSNRRVKESCVFR